MKPTAAAAPKKEVAGGLELEYTLPPDALVRAFLATTRPLAPATAAAAAPASTAPQPAAAAQSSSSGSHTARYCAPQAKEDPEHIYQSVDECLSDARPEQHSNRNAGDAEQVVSRGPPPPPPHSLPLTASQAPVVPVPPAAPAPDVDLIMFTPAPSTLAPEFTFGEPASPSAASHVYSSVIRLEPQLAAALTAPIASLPAADSSAFGAGGGAPGRPKSPDYTQVADTDMQRYLSFPFTPLPNSVTFSLAGNF